MRKPLGFYAIHKPKGVSSTRIVGQVKRRLPRKTKVGHCGTLDPLAEGLLPIAFGPATRLVSELQDADKVYRFQVLFGKEHESGDLDSPERASCSNIPTHKQIVAVLPQFTGLIDQRPPRYSALKIDGRRAYDLVRAGVDFQVPTRQIQIYKLELIAYNTESKIAQFQCRCSKGTYIRSLAQDLARATGSLGVVVELIRVQVGKMRLEQALFVEDLPEIEYHSDTSLLGACSAFFDPRVLWDDIPVVTLDDQAVCSFMHGQELFLDSEPNWSSSLLTKPQRCFVQTKNLQLIGVAKAGHYSKSLKADKVFQSQIEEFQE